MTAHPFHPLVAEAERLLDQDRLDPDEVVELARQVQRRPPDDPEVGRTLLTLVDTLTRRAAAELEEIERALKNAATSKKALSGYGFVKPNRKNQRANKVV